MSMRRLRPDFAWMDPHFLGPSVFTALFLLAAMALPAYAQDDNPFGEGAEEGDTIVLGEAPLELNESTNSLLLRSVAQSNPTSAMQLCRAIDVMIDIEEWDAANNYLGKFAEVEIDGPSAYELNDKIGSDFFYRLARADSLQPTGLEQAKKIFELATQWANSRERIDGLLDQLASENVIVRSEAFERLRRVGNPAVARILESFLDEDRKDQFAGLRGALYRFNEKAVPVLVGAAHADPPEVRLEAIRALAKQNSNEAFDEMMWAWLTPDAPQQIRATANAAINNAGVSIDRGQVERKLAERVRRFLSGRRIGTDNISGTLGIWQWNPETSQLESREVEPEAGTRQRGVRLAKSLYNINPGSAENQKLLLLSELESRKRAVGPSRRIDHEGFLNAYPGTSANRINTLLEQAIELNLIPAAIACCEILKHTGDTAQLHGRPSPLVASILSGERQLQFAAFDAIAEIDPQSPFEGCSYVSDFATFIASSRFQRAALVGHNREEIARATASALLPLKWQGDSAAATRELFDRVDTNPDLEILLIADSLTQPAVRELVQQLRANWKTKHLPIGILAASEDRLIRSSQLTAGADRLLTFPITSNTQALARQMGQLEKLQSTWAAVSSDDRYAHASRAIEWLGQVSTDPHYGFYNAGHYQRRMLDWLYHPEFTEPAAKILASNPTPAAQQALVSFISQNELPIDARQAVANAFEQAVKTSGTLLTTSEISLQYDRYNASENQPKETQQVLGRVLDIIEAAAQ